MIKPANRPKTAFARRARTFGAATVAATALLAGAVVIGPAGAASTHSAKGVTVSTVKNSKLGTILISGRTLYTLSPSKIACAVKCLKTWPELKLPSGVTKATAGKGVASSKLGTVRRSGGVVQVTYGGRALYLFTGDTAVGQVHGNVTDKWGKWAVVVTVKPSSGSSGSGTGGVAF